MVVPTRMESFARMRAAEIYRGRAGVIGAGVGAYATRGGVGRVRDDVDAIAEFFKRHQGFGKFKARAFLCRRPFIHGRAVGHIDTAQAALGGGRGAGQGRLRRHHGIEQR